MNFFNPTIIRRPAGTSVFVFGEISQCGHHSFFMETGCKGLYWEKGGQSRHILRKKKGLKIAIFRQWILGGGQNITGF